MGKPNITLSWVSLMKIGIDLGGTKVEVIAIGDDHKELFRKRVPTPRDDYQGTVDAIVGLVVDAETATGLIGTVGIGIPGTLSPVTGLMKNANSIWLNGRPFDVDLSKAMNREVRLANDANCLAVSEAVDGVAAGKKLVYGVIIGTGCGGGLAINRVVHNGRNGVSGEWGHNPLPWPTSDEVDQNACYCGHNSCLETWISGTGFCRSYEKLSGQLLKGHGIVQLAEQGDELANQALTLYEHRLARSLATIVNQIDPDAIVLGGGMSNVERIYKNVPELMSQWVFGLECDTPILKAQHGDSSGVRGAAFLWD